MDGNGRWAGERGLPRTAGHRKGIDSVRTAVRTAGDLGISFLTLFGFSSENWARPESEVRELMRLLRYYLKSETADLHKNGIKLRVIGERDAFDKDIVQMIRNAEALTAENDKMTLVIALNYGGRREIARAALRMVEDFRDSECVLDGDLAEKIFPQYLMTHGIPDPDLLIRTSGEQRISNFLLWQCAYAEFVFVDSYWPDFSRETFEEAIKVYARRDRRFGAVKTGRRDS